MIDWEDFRVIVWNNIEKQELFQKEKILPETNLMEDLQFDSVAMITLFSDIEEKWGIDFTDLEDFGDRFDVCGKIYEGIRLLREKGDGG